VDQSEEVPARAAGVGDDDAENGVDGNGGINGVASCGDDVETRLRREVMR